MNRIIGTIIITGLALTATTATAQERAVGSGRAELTAYPGGGIVFTDTSGESDFTNYAVGGTFTYNLTRYLGVEADSGGSLGVDQRLNLAEGARSSRSPNFFGYTGNAVVYPVGNRRAFVPYATGGIGGLTLFSRQALGVNDTTTFLTGNVGGGVKYYLSERWGLRADYRFPATRSQDDAPAFFGRDNRYGHRVSAGIVLNLLP
ncbi:MAG: outer membrane protein [Vicinamibacterales bacterium]